MGVTSPFTTHSAVLAAPAAPEAGALGLWLSLWLKRFFVIIPTLIAFFLSYVVVNMIPPRYASETRVFVENRESIYARALGAEKGALPEGLALDQEAIASHVQLMYSRDLARAVVQKLKLYKLSEFDSVPRRSALTFPLLFLGLVKDKSRMTAEERVLESFFERLNVFAVDRSRVIEIRFQAQDPDVAARVANEIANTYLELQLQAKLERDRKASQYVENKIDELRRQAEDAEAQVADFRAVNGLYVGENETSLTAQSLSELNTQLATALTQKVEAQAKADGIRAQLKQGKSIEVDTVLNSPLIQNLITQRTALRGDIAEQSTTLLPGHPKIKELQAKHADIERQIKTEAEKLVANYDAEVKVADARVESLKKEFEGTKKTSTLAGDKEVTLRALEREAKAQRDLLEAWLAMYREAVARDSLQARNVDARIVSVAAPSNSVAFPKKGPIIVVATLGMFLLCAMLVFTRELASGRAFSLVPLPAALPLAAVGAPAPAVLPPVHHTVAGEAPSLPDIHASNGFTLEPRDEAAALSEILYTLLAPERDDGQPQTVLVAGATSAVQEGQFALKLGRALTQAKRRAVIVDANALRPQLSLIVTGYNGKGLSELLAGKASFASVLYRDAKTRLNIIPFGTAQRDLPRSSFARPSFNKAVKALEATYDFVVIAGPAIGETLDAADLAMHVDRVIMIAYEGMPEDLIIKARDAFLAAGVAQVDVPVLINAGTYKTKGRAQLVDV